MRTFAFTLGLVLLAACSKPASDPNPPTTTTSAEPGGDGEEQPDVDSGSAERPGITAAACEAEGGTVVGDIGDGAIHKPDYRCPESGEPPIGSIIADPDGPVAIEGAVCCK